MKVYQVYQIDYDHSVDQNDVMPTDLLFEKREDAEAYVAAYGGVVIDVTVR